MILVSAKTKAELIVGADGLLADSEVGQSPAKVSVAQFLKLLA